MFFSAMWIKCLYSHVVGMTQPPPWSTSGFHFNFSLIFVLPEMKKSRQNFFHFSFLIEKCMPMFWLKNLTETAVVDV
jgi:hypothetical protein